MSQLLYHILNPMIRWNSCFVSPYSKHPTKSQVAFKHYSYFAALYLFEFPASSQKNTFPFLTPCFSILKSAVKLAVY